MLYRYEKQPLKVVNKTSKKKSSLLTIVTASVLLLFGLGILFYTSYPYASKYISGIFTDESALSKSLLTPSANEQVFSQRTSLPTLTQQNMSSDYVSNVSNNINLTNKILNIGQITHPEYENIQGEMKLSIPKLKIKEIPIKINVDSLNENVYMQQLNKTLAHFKSTSLPDKPGNTFIYGHSANELLAKTAPTDPKYAFTYLDGLDPGDEIIVRYNDRDYKYAVIQTKQVDPTDISAIYTTSNEKILTLMTCWTPGVGEKRLIVTAKQVNN
jgi:LPXTG-site transpeptidase (sortase) family protein